jgi:O-antigen/teichoic acid export membrane protein
MPGEIVTSSSTQPTLSKATTVRNILYTSVTKGTTLICVALTSSVVARNLSPADYGVVGFGSIVIGFLRNFSDLGIGTAAIQRPQLDRGNLSTAFTLKLVLSLGAFAAAMLIAPFAHFSFKHPATSNVIRFLSLNFLVSTIGFIPLVALTRERNFRALLIPGVTGAVVRCLLAIALVLHGSKYWAVVAADVGATLATGIVTQITKRLPVACHFDWVDAREYLRFGLPLFGSGLLVFLIFNLDNFLVGCGMGSGQLGCYALAFNWGSFVCIILADTLNTVLLPTLSAIQHDLAAIRRCYLKAVDLAAFVSVVANTALLANAHYFLVTILGKGSEKWAHAVVSFKVLCIYGIIRAVTEPLWPTIMACGRTKRLLHANMLAGAIEISLLLLVLRSGRIEWVAAVVLFAYASQAAVYLPFLRRELGIHAGDIAAQAWPVIPALVGGYAITSLLPASLGTTVFSLAARGVFTGLVAALLHGVCTRFRCFQEASGMIMQQFAHVRA